MPKKRKHVHQYLDSTSNQIVTNKKKEENVLEVGEAKGSGEERSQANSCKQSLNLRQFLAWDLSEALRDGLRKDKTCLASVTWGNLGSCRRICGRI